MGATVQRVQADWVQPFQALSTVYNYAASGAAPFGFERLFVHAGAWYPIVMVDTSATWAAGAPAAAYSSHAISRFKLTADGALFRPTRVQEDLDNLWDVPFEATILERLR